MDVFVMRRFSLALTVVEKAASKWRRQKQAKPWAEMHQAEYMHITPCWVYSQITRASGQDPL